MPWDIKKSGKQYLVVNKDNGKVAGKHKSKKEARAQQKALYSNVPDAKPSKSGNKRVLTDAIDKLRRQ